MEKSEKLKTQLIIVTGLLILYFIFKAETLLYSAAIAGITFILFPLLGDLVVKAWFKLAETLGWINSRILLSAIFYLFLFPLAILKKLSGGDSLHLKNKTHSLFETINHKYSKKDLENTW